MSLITGRIYKIYRPCDEKTVYIGSTTQKLNLRFNEHVSSYKRFLNGKYRYITSFDILKHEDAEIQLLKEVKVDSLEELHILENEYINKYKKKNFNVLNKRKAFETESEKEESQKEAVKKYRNKNKEQIRERRNKKFDCECGGRYSNGNKWKHLKTHIHITYILNNCTVNIQN